jgi:hypothetical protein
MCLENNGGGPLLHHHSSQEAEAFNHDSHVLNYDFNSDMICGSRTHGLDHERTTTQMHLSFYTISGACNINNDGLCHDDMINHHRL